MTYAKLLMSISLAAPLALIAGCNRNSADEQNKAIAAQHEADEKIAKVQNEAEQKAAEAQKKADDTATQARNEANKDTSQAQAKANDVIRAADESISKSRMDIRDWAQKKLDSFDSDIDGAKTKAQTASTKAKENFDHALTDVQAQRAAVQKDVTLLDAQPGATLDQWKARLEKEFDALRTSVTRLENTV